MAFSVGIAPKSSISRSLHTARHSSKSIYLVLPDNDRTGSNIRLEVTRPDALQNPNLRDFKNPGSSENFVSSCLGPLLHRVAPAAKFTTEGRDCLMLLISQLQRYGTVLVIHAHDESGCVAQFVSIFLDGMEYAHGNEVSDDGGEGGSDRK